MCVSAFFGVCFCCYFFVFFFVCIIIISTPKIRNITCLSLFFQLYKCCSWKQSTHNWRKKERETWREWSNQQRQFQDAIYILYTCFMNILNENGLAKQMRMFLFSFSLDPSSFYFLFHFLACVRHFLGFFTHIFLRILFHVHPFTSNSKYPNRRRHHKSHRLEIL